MLSSRLQVLIDPERRRLLDAEARRRGTSVASLVREAVDARFGGVAKADRLRAVDDLRKMRGRFVEPGELERIGAAQRDAAGDAVARTSGR